VRTIKSKRELLKTSVLISEFHAQVILLTACGPSSLNSVELEISSELLQARASITVETRKCLDPVSVQIEPVKQTIVPEEGVGHREVFEEAEGVCV